MNLKNSPIDTPSSESAIAVASHQERKPRLRLAADEMKGQGQVAETLMGINLVAFATILRKEIMRILRIWPQTLFPPLITTFLYLLIFGQWIGERIGTIRGIPYMEFIIPGLILMSVLVNSYTNVVTSFFSQKFVKSVEEMLVAPISPFFLLLGFVCGGIFRGMLLASCLLFLATFFYPFQIVSLGWFFLILGLASILFSLIGFANAMFATKFDDVTIIPTFIITPMTYLGGTFYSVSELPSPWREMSAFNPIFYLVDGFRYSMTGVHETELFESFFILLAMILLIGGWNLWALRTGFRLKS